MCVCLSLCLSPPPWTKGSETGQKAQKLGRRPQNWAEGHKTGQKAITWQNTLHWGEGPVLGSSVPTQNKIMLLNASKNWVRIYVSRNTKTIFWSILNTYGYTFDYTYCQKSKKYVLTNIFNKLPNDIVNILQKSKNICHRNTQILSWFMLNFFPNTITNILPKSKHICYKGRGTHI